MNCKFARLETYSSPTTTVTTSDSKYLIFSFEEINIRIQSIQEGKEIAILRGHESFVIALSVSFDSKYIISSSFDKTIKVWDFSKKKQEYSFYCGDFTVNVSDNSE